jgi:CheY-like chemotaxis protein
VARFDGLRILIVDDDRESCDMMLEVLRGHGATGGCATSATDAIGALPEFKPDLVMSDIAMPGRDGYAVLTEVRAIETTLGRRVPVAAVSAYAHAHRGAHFASRAKTGFRIYVVGPRGGGGRSAPHPRVMEEFL